MNDENPYISPQESSAPVAVSADEPAWDNKSFWGMVFTQFLGAFNDNLFKQLVLLLAIPVAIAAELKSGDPPAAGVEASVPADATVAAESNKADLSKSAKASTADNEVKEVGAGKADIQGPALAIFSIPFLLFSGYAGYLSERFSKQRVIFLCKVAEIGIVLLGMVGFLLYDRVGIAGLFVVLGLMGTHSAFFGPGKYGILPELFPTKNLAMVNGVVLMTTFLAIIFGTALAGVLKDQLGNQQLWVASLVCVAIAVVGTQTAHMVRKTPPVDPKLQLTWSALVVPEEVLALMRKDGPLVRALLSSCMFWLVGGIVFPSANSLGKKQFLVSETSTSILAACMGLGIMVGSLLAATLSKQAVNWRLVKIGAWGIFGCLVVMSIPGTARFNLAGLAGSHVILLLLGLFAGLYAVPISVFLQSRPPKDCKGRVIATMNLANWIAIVMSAGIYAVFDLIVIKAGWPHYYKFAFTAVLILPVAILYRPSNQE